MGQQSSSPQELTLEQVAKLFAKRCNNLFAPIELHSLKRLIEQVADKEDSVVYLKEDTLLKILDLTDDSMLPIGSLLYRSASFLAGFPFLQSLSPAPLTRDGLVKTLSIYDGRIERILGENYPRTKLIFLSFAVAENGRPLGDDEKRELARESEIGTEAGPSAPQKNVLNDEFPPTIEKGEYLSECSSASHLPQPSGRIPAPDIHHWAEFGPIKSLDNIDVTQYTMTGSDFLVLVQYLLSIADYKPHRPIHGHHARFGEHKAGFKEAAETMLRSVVGIECMKSTAPQDIRISYEQFEAGLSTLFPGLLIPLGCLFSRFLFYDFNGDTANEETPAGELRPRSTIVTDAIMSQLQFMFKDRMNSVIRLWAGSEDGFSMRSFENKIFKWNAPTILIISGKLPKKKKQTSHFHEFSSRLPKMVANDQLIDDSVHTHTRLLFGVYVESPWRSSAKTCFADSRTRLLQLSPELDIYKSSLTPDYGYFCHQEGIGFGSPVPSKHDLSDVGSISLTIEENFEYACFRHVGPQPGAFAIGNSANASSSYEYRFAVTEVEVWGCGKQEDLDEQKRQWQWEEQEARKRQGVNLDAHEDRALLEMAGIVGQYSDRR